MSTFLALISLAGVIANSIINFLIYIFTKGRASYFNIPVEYLMVNYRTTIYDVIINSCILLTYIVIDIGILRTILRQQSFWKKAGVIICTVTILPMICLLIGLIFCLESPSQLLLWTEDEWLDFFELATALIVCIHIPFVIGIGLITYPIQQDLIKRKKKEKKPEKNQKRKAKDYMITKVLVGTVYLAFLGGFFYYLGVRSVIIQKDFQITLINNDPYVVVMTDGDTAIVKQYDIKQKDVLKINEKLYMKVSCENLSLENKYFKKGIVK